MGAEVIPVHSGSATLKDACNEALRDWSGSTKPRTICWAPQLARILIRPLCVSFSG